MSSGSDSRPLFERLAPYRLPSVHSNFAYRVPLNGRWVFLKIYGPKTPRLKYEFRRFLGRMGMRQPVEYRTPMARKAFEEETLRRWKAKGFPVPDVLDTPYPEWSALPHLTTTFIEGVTLRERLSGGRLSPEDKGRLLFLLFEEVNRRHEEALAVNDRLLFHVDANTRNILCADDGMIYHVDFDMGRPWEPAIACAAREITKLLTTAAEDMPLTEQKDLYHAFQRAYRHEDVRRFIGKSVYGRPFQGLHRWMDRRKKGKNPRVVTLYDILDRLPPDVISL